MLTAASGHHEPNPRPALPRRQPVTSGAGTDQPPAPADLPPLPPSAITCLDCHHVWHGEWRMEMECPRCRRGFTLPMPRDFRYFEDVDEIDDRWDFCN